MRYLLSALALLVALPAAAQHSHPAQREIVFPDVTGFRTLACDFHMHSVFSDGSVWPDIRVQEAQRDGLDCIAVTEHLEYQPRREDIPHPDRNRAFALASRYAGDSDLIVLNGSEITRDMPPGHANAVFVEDANALLTGDARAAYEAASAQGAFTFWNHPNWTSQRKDGISTLTDMHRSLIADGLLHGIEVVNETTYSEEALQIALEHDLAILATSDIHGLIDWAYDVHGKGHRPVTLVFADERSPAGIKAALVARRTVGYFNGSLIGRERDLRPLVQAALVVASARYVGDTQVLSVVLANRSSAPFVLLNQSSYTFHEDTDLVVVEPHAEREIQVKTVTRVAAIDLAFDVVNTVTAPKERLRIQLPVAVAKE